MSNPSGRSLFLFPICHTARCTSIRITRPFQFCVELVYEGREVPYAAIPALIAFNAANRTVRELLDKGPSLVRSVRMVLDDERRLRRDVVVASLGADGADSLQNCQDNLDRLRTVVVPGAEEIARRTRALFDELHEAARDLVVASA